MFFLTSSITSHTTLSTTWTFFVLDDDDFFFLSFFNKKPFLIPKVAFFALFCCSFLCRSFWLVCADTAAVIICSAKENDGASDVLFVIDSTPMRCIHWVDNVDDASLVTKHGSTMTFSVGEMRALLLNLVSFSSISSITSNIFFGAASFFISEAADVDDSDWSSTSTSNMLFRRAPSWEFIFLFFYVTVLLCLPPMSRSNQANRSKSMTWMIVPSSGQEVKTYVFIVQ